MCYLKYIDNGNFLCGLNEKQNQIQYCHKQLQCTPVEVKWGNVCLANVFCKSLCERMGSKRISRLSTICPFNPSQIKGLLFGGLAAEIALRCIDMIRFAIHSMRWMLMAMANAASYLPSIFLGTKKRFARLAHWSVAQIKDIHRLESNLLLWGPPKDSLLGIYVFPRGTKTFPSPLNAVTSMASVSRFSCLFVYFAQKSFN